MKNPKWNSRVEVNYTYLLGVRGIELTAHCMPGNEKSQMKLQGRGKLHLPPRCKGYWTHSTLYAISTIISNNSQDDVLPLAPVDLDCCLTFQEREQLSEISLDNPLTNILSSVEDLKIASVKIDEIQEMIHEEEKKKFEHLSLSMTTWGSVMLTIVIFVTCICCSCCCCKCCRQLGFWIWDKWTLKECLKQTRERCCIINNFSAERINYTEVPQTSLDSPPSSPVYARSLPISWINTARRRINKAVHQVERMKCTRKFRKWNIKMLLLWGITHNHKSPAIVVLVTFCLLIFWDQ